MLRKTLSLLMIGVVWSGGLCSELALAQRGTAAQSGSRPARPATRPAPRGDRYEAAVRAGIAQKRVDKARELQAYRAGQYSGYRSGAVAGAVRNEIRNEARRRYYRGLPIYRPYGKWYPGYGVYRDDNSAWKWLAFTAITLKVLDNLNEAAQRKHEEAQIRATAAALHQPVYWVDGDARGHVTAVRQFSQDGLQCREFQQVVEIGGRSEDAYGTACLQPDGAWKIVN